MTVISVCISLCMRLTGYNRFGELRGSGHGDSNLCVFMGETGEGADIASLKSCIKANSSSLRLES